MDFAAASPPSVIVVIATSPQLPVLGRRQSLSHHPTHLQRLCSSSPQLHSAPNGALIGRLWTSQQPFESSSLLSSPLPHLSPRRFVMSLSGIDAQHFGGYGISSDVPPLSPPFPMHGFALPHDMDVDLSLNSQQQQQQQQQQQGTARLASSFLPHACRYGASMPACLQQQQALASSPLSPFTPCMNSSRQQQQQQQQQQSCYSFQPVGPFPQPPAPSSSSGFASSAHATHGGYGGLGQPFTSPPTPPPPLHPPPARQPGFVSMDRSLSQPPPPSRFPPDPSSSCESALLSLFNTGATQLTMQPKLPPRQLNLVVQVGLISPDEGIPSFSTPERRDFMALLHRALHITIGEGLHGSSTPEDLASPTASLLLTFADGDKGILAKQQLLDHPNLPLQVGGKTVMVPLLRVIRPATTAATTSRLLIHHPALGDFARVGASTAILAACGLFGVTVMTEFLGRTGKHTQGATPGLPDPSRIIAVVPKASAVSFSSHTFNLFGSVGSVSLLDGKVSPPKVGVSSSSPASSHPPPPSPSPSFAPPLSPVSTRAHAPPSSIAPDVVPGLSCAPTPAPTSPTLAPRVLSSSGRGSGHGRPAPVSSSQRAEVPAVQPVATATPSPPLHGPSTRPSAAASVPPPPPPPPPPINVKCAAPPSPPCRKVRAQSPKPAAAVPPSQGGRAAAQVAQAPGAPPPSSSPPSPPSPL